MLVENLEKRVLVDRMFTTARSSVVARARKIFDTHFLYYGPSTMALDST